MDNREYSNSVLNKLDESAWKNMNQEERLALLQEFENYLAARTGRDACQIRVMPDEVLKKQEEGTVLNGYFNRGDGCIYINPKFLTSKMDNPGVSMFHFGAALAVIAHEGRHAWQHYAVEHPEKKLLSRKDRLALVMNFAAYQDGEYSVYASQLLEYDARHFATSVMRELSQFMEKKDGHPCRAFVRWLREDRIRETMLAAKVMAELDKTEIEAFEENLRKQLERVIPGVDFSDVSMFEAAKKLLETGNVGEFLDGPPIKIIKEMAFREGAGEEASSERFSEIDFKVGSVKLDEQKKAGLFRIKGKRI